VPKFEDVKTSLTPTQLMKAKVMTAEEALKSGALIFAVNGELVTIPANGVDPSMSLNTYLREICKLKGTKLSCGEGGCGACAVTLSRWDHKANKEIFKSVNSCLAPMPSVHGWAVTTIEGLRSKALERANKTAADASSSAKKEKKTNQSDEDEKFHPISARVANMNGLQCGYCTPGMVMTIYQTLKKNPNATMAEIESQFDGNICRCTGFRPILDAAKSFASDADIKDHICKRNLSLGCYDQKLWDQEFPASLKGFGKLNGPLKFENKYVVWVRPSNSMNAVVAAMREYPNAKFVVGRTSTGIYKPVPLRHETETKGVEHRATGDLLTEKITLIDVADIDEMHSIADKKVGSKKYLKIGGASKISNVMKALKSSNVKAFEVLHNHLKKVANVHVRDSGSIAGNLILAKTKGFLSDIATILFGAGAEITWTGESGSTKMDMEAFLSTPKLPAMQVLTSILLPYPGPNAHFETYRAAIRPLNAHAICNAAFSACVKNNTLTEVRLVCAGLLNHEDIGARALRIEPVEKLLEGNSLDNKLFTSAMDAMAKFASDKVNASGGLRQASRIQLASSFLVRFLLSAAGENVKPDFESAVKGLDELRGKVVKAKQEFSYPTTQAPVSMPIPLRTGKMLASGAAKYTSDIKVSHGTLFAAMAVARRARSRIKKIDMSLATKMPGVKGFVSKAETGDTTWAVFGDPHPWDLEDYRVPLIFIGEGDIVPYHNHPVALIVATTKAQATAAASQVMIEFTDTKKPLLHIADSIKQKQICPPVSSLPIRATKKKGDAKKQLADIKEGKIDESKDDELSILNGDMEVGGQKHFYMENHVCYCIPDEEFGMKVHMCTQFPNASNEVIAKALGVPHNMVNIIHHRMGGAFGGKYNAHIASTVALAAKKFKKPVMLYLNKNIDGSMIKGRGHTAGTYNIGYNKNSGQIKALKFRSYKATGSCINIGWFENLSLSTALSQVYRLPHLDIVCSMVLTSEPPLRAVRGPGEIEASVMMENIIEHVAHAIGKDAHEVRKVNMLKNEEKELKDYGLVGEFENYTMTKIWEELEKRCDFYTRAKAVKDFNKANKLKKRGICMTPLRYFMNIWKQSALVNLYTDGTVIVTHGGSNMGQGMHLKVAQVVAYELGLLTGKSLSIDDIKFTPNSSHALSCQSFTGGSTGSEGCAEAARRACAELVSRMRPILESMEAKAKAAKGDGQERLVSITFAEVCATAAAGGVQMQALGHWADTKGKNKASYNSFGACCSEIELDVLTGEMVLLRSDLYYDAAKSLNPAVDMGQAEGAFMMGVGHMTQEEEIFDENSGELLSNGTWEYKPPLAINVPKVFNVTFLQGNTSGRVLSSKASGEPPLVMSTSVFFAIRHAISSARQDAGDTKFFKLTVPATVTSRIKALQPAIDALKTQPPLKG